VTKRGASANDKGGDPTELFSSFTGKSMTSQSHISTLRELLSQAPSFASWPALCDCLDTIESDDINFVKDYLTPHLESWPNEQKAPPYRWWKQAKNDEAPPFWELITHPHPYDEILGIFQCECLSTVKDIDHLGAGILLCRQSGLELLHTKQAKTSVWLDNERLANVDITPFLWDVHLGIEDSLRVSFSDEETLDIRLNQYDQVGFAMYLLKGRQDNCQTQIEQEQLPHPHFERITRKWNLWFECAQQSIEKLLVQTGPYLRTYSEATQALPLAPIRELANARWDSLSPGSQKCLLTLCDPWEGAWDWKDEEDSEGTKWLAPSELLASTMQELLQPGEEENTGTDTTRFLDFLEVLKRGQRETSFIQVSLSWGY
jgi:hypothetical protein